MPEPIFLSFRTEDAADQTRDLRDRLTAVFGEGTVFFDGESIRGSQSLSARVREGIEGCTVLVVVMGKDWLTAQGKWGKRKLDDPEDWVRQEVALAFDCGKHVLSVLLEGAELPPAEALVEGVTQLADRKALNLRAREERASDFQRLVDTLAELTGLAPRAVASTLEDQPVDDEQRLACYRSFLRSAHANLVPFFADAGREMLEEVYVELALQWEVRRESPEGMFDAIGKGFAGSGEPTLASLLAEHEARWVVLGEPGAGKSTLARHLAWELADPATCSIETAPGDAEDPVPIYVSLPRLSLEHCTPFALAEQDALAHDERRGAGLAETLRALADEDGKVWLLLDGLDEVAPERLGTIEEHLKAFAKDLPHCRIAVFSRPIGYRELPAPFRHAGIRPLDSGRQRRLLDRWLDEADAEEVWQRLEARPALQELAANPLLLTLVAKLSLVPGAELPSTRWELYDQAVSLLLTRGARPDPTPHPVRDPESARRLLEALALELQEDATPTWTPEHLDDVLNRVRQTDSDLNFRLKENWGTKDRPGTNTDFLGDVAHNSGVLGSHDGPHAPWRFLHRQLREFLAAACIHREGGDVAARLRERIENLDEDGLARWAEVYGFVASRQPEPLSLLAELRELSAPLARRALGEVEGVDAGAELLEFLLAEQPILDLGKEGWDGRDLRAVCRGLLAGATTTREHLADLLLNCLEPDQPVELHAAFLWTLRELEIPLDEDDFFDRCCRPRLLEGDDRQPQWVDVPEATYLRGSPEGVGDDDERPRLEVHVPRFRLAQTPVTNEQYAAFAPGFQPEGWGGAYPPTELARVPAVNVNWWSAWLYCAWIGARLPSEAEWERACRAGTDTAYSFGDDPRGLIDHGWFDANSDDRAHPVGEKRPNALGLFDMHGNVDEWCEDTYGAYGGAPTDGAAARDSRAPGRVCRGGGWDDSAEYCRSASRYWRDPEDRDRWYVGFRPARSYP